MLEIAKASFRGESGMADEIDEAAARAEDRGEGIDRAKAILTEFVEATRSAIEAMLDDRKHRAAQQVGGFAEAVRCAAQCFERSDSRAIAGYADRAANQLDQLSHLIRERHWSEIVADAEDLARHRPTLFIIGATAIGFLAGRLLSVPTDRPRPDKTGTGPDLSPHRGETDEITAAVSKLVAEPASVASESR
jgi:hypothetical protein